jgi:hypothetical protein
MVRSFEEAPFAMKKPLANAFSPAMIRALDDPVFFDALWTTVTPSGFSLSKGMEAMPEPHPQWQALHERSILRTLLSPPMLSGPHPKQ